jgi:hypothetical protein
MPSLERVMQEIFVELERIKDKETHKGEIQFTENGKLVAVKIEIKDSLKIVGNNED